MSEYGNHAEGAQAAADVLPSPWPVLEDDCPRCEGVGVVSDPAWMAWHEREMAERAEWYKTRTPDADWWRSPEYRALEDDEPQSDAEEYDCPKCRGCGTVPTAAGQQLLRFIRNHR